MDKALQLLNLAKRIQALSENGVHYADNDYDLDRYNEMDKISKEMIALIGKNSLDTISLEITEKNGYKTPKVDVRAVVFNKEGQILMVREKIDGHWSLPGGWADVGFTPAEIAVKETFEEAGQKVEAKRLLAVLDKKCYDHPPDVHYAYKIFIECIAIDNTLDPGYETLDANYFSLENLPELSTPRNTWEQIEMMFKMKDQRYSWPILDLS